MQTHPSLNLREAGSPTRDRPRCGRELATGKSGAVGPDQGFWGSEQGRVKAADVTYLPQFCLPQPPHCVRHTPPTGCRGHGQRPYILHARHHICTHPLLLPSHHVCATRGSRSPAVLGDVVTAAVHTHGGQEAPRNGQDRSWLYPCSLHPACSTRLSNSHTPARKVRQTPELLP